MSCPLATERVWVEKSKYHDAEKDYFEHLSKLLKGTSAKENLGNNDNNTTESVSVKVKKNKKFKAHANEAVEGLLSENDVTTLDKNNSEASKNDEVKAKKKKKKKNNKENSEKSQETNAKVNDSQDQRKDDSLKRQKSNSKLKAPATNQCALVSEIAKARQHIKNSLERMDGIAALAASPNSAGSDVVDRLVVLEKENAGLRELVESLKKCCMDTQKRVLTLETRLQALTLSQSDQKPTPSAVKKVEKPQTDNDNDDGVDLFASESEEDEEANTIREQRLAEYHAKKSKKPALIAKSSLVLDIKPWDDETDLGKMEKEIRKITTDGLLWGASKLQPVAFGIKKLVLSCVVEDEKVSIDWLTEEIEKLDDYVQSVDVAAFNKI